VKFSQFSEKFFFWFGGFGVQDLSTYSQDTILEYTLESEKVMAKIKKFKKRTKTAKTLYILFYATAKELNKKACQKTSFFDPQVDQLSIKS
jgi:hypothetical protein